jgi:hypothetical protein
MGPRETRSWTGRSCFRSACLSQFPISPCFGRNSSNTPVKWSILVLPSFVIEHHRRRILHFNTTTQPTGEWTVQQQAFPLPCPYRYVVFDRDRKFGTDVREFLKSSGIKAVRTSVRSPWQNGVAERWVGSIRREMLDHVIPLNERHLMQLSHAYITYYHEDRTHIGLDKETRSVAQSSRGRWRLRR